MNNECRPPEGTPDGAKCVLEHRKWRHQHTWRWKSGTWRRPFFGTLSPNEMSRMGYQFLSIAEVPNEH